MTVQKHVSRVCMLAAKKRTLSGAAMPIACCQHGRSLQVPSEKRSHVCPVACGSACSPAAAFTAHRSPVHGLLVITHVRSAIVRAHVAFSCAERRTRGRFALSQTQLQDEQPSAAKSVNQTQATTHRSPPSCLPIFSKDSGPDPRSASAPAPPKHSALRQLLA